MQPSSVQYNLECSAYKIYELSYSKDQIYQRNPNLSPRFKQVFGSMQGLFYILYSIIIWRKNIDLVDQKFSMKKTPFCTRPIDDFLQ